jgi:hypothetical protein
MCVCVPITLPILPITSHHVIMSACQHVKHVTHRAPSLHLYSYYRTVLNYSLPRRRQVTKNDGAHPSLLTTPVVNDARMVGARRAPGGPVPALRHEKHVGRCPTSIPAEARGEPAEARAAAIGRGQGKVVGLREQEEL